MLALVHFVWCLAWDWSKPWSLDGWIVGVGSLDYWLLLSFLVVIIGSDNNALKTLILAYQFWIINFLKSLNWAFFWAFLCLFWSRFFSLFVRSAAYFIHNFVPAVGFLLWISHAFCRSINNKVVAIAGLSGYFSFLEALAALNIVFLSDQERMAWAVVSLTGRSNSGKVCLMQESNLFRYWLTLY